MIYLRCSLRVTISVFDHISKPKLNMDLQYVKLFNNLRECEECHADDHPFVYDSVHAHYSCRNCGIVKHAYHDLGYGITFQNSEPRSPRVQMTPMETPKKEGEKQKVIRVPAHVFYWDTKKQKLFKYLSKFSENFDLPDNVLEKSITLVEKNIGNLSEEDMDNNRKNILKLRGLDNTALALLIITSQTYGINMSVKMTQHMMAKKNLNKHVKKICRMMGINIASLGKSRINNVCSLLNISFRTTRKIERTFCSLKNKHQNIGEDTLLAVSIYKHIAMTFQDQKDAVGEIVKVVGVNKNTINKYLKQLNV